MVIEETRFPVLLSVCLSVIIKGRIFEPETQMSETQ